MRDEALLEMDDAILFFQEEEDDIDYYSDEMKLNKAGTYRERLPIFVST